jgi:hypothetical protein
MGGAGGGREGFEKDKRNIFRKTLKFQNLRLLAETVMV